MTGPNTIRRGEIYAARLGAVEGSEQAGTRPVLVMSNDAFNEVMPIVTILPLTSLRRGRRVYPSEVFVTSGTGGLRRDSLVLGHQIRTITTARLGRRIGRLPAIVLRQVDDALLVHLDLDPKR